jgi:hypothetical protein
VERSHDQWLYTICTEPMVTSVEVSLNRVGPSEPRTSDPALPHVKTEDHTDCLLRITRPVPNGPVLHSTIHLPRIRRSKHPMKMCRRVERTDNDPCRVVKTGREHARGGNSRINSASKTHDNL